MVTPRPSLLRTLAILACTLAFSFFVTGCGMSRAHYEKESGLQVLTEYTVQPTDTLKHAQPGDMIVVYGPTNDPRIDPVSGVYTCPEGVRVVTYRNGVMVGRYFQEHSPMTVSK